ncbi:hypothetical protein [Telluria aromaticivorans]|uniref:Uncharacterized protein n=1 Tax=Telluria aromaticivorans TaxID=2725995 RepID=A0A7Y2K1G3_9BURK|nr:hypothetical protein [Telluria aromaticivorans]NNG24608.1 hypothetical protein [Telluria aromaticivorans]
MRLDHGYAAVTGFVATGWHNPLSSPLVALAAGRIAALAWAFQQQGWACCIPLLAVLAGKTARLAGRTYSKW